MPLSLIESNDARRTCATLLVDLDVHPRVIMRILRQRVGGESRAQGNGRLLYFAAVRGCQAKAEPAPNATDQVKRGRVTGSEPVGWTRECPRGRALFAKR